MNKIASCQEISPENHKKKGKANLIDVEVGRQLKARRILLGLSQEDLASKVDLTFQQIQKYESGANRISASRLYEFSIVLDYPVEFFFSSWNREVKARNEKPAFDDPLKSKETLDIITQYYSLETKELRSRFMALLKSVSKSQK